MKPLGTGRPHFCGMAMAASADTPLALARGPVAKVHRHWGPSALAPIFLTAAQQAESGAAFPWDAARQGCNVMALQAASTFTTSAKPSIRANAANATIPEILAIPISVMKKDTKARNKVDVAEDQWSKQRRVDDDCLQKRGRVLEFILAIVSFRLHSL